MNRPPSSQNPKSKFWIYSEIILKDISELQDYADNNNLEEEYDEFEHKLLNLIGYE